MGCCLQTFIKPPEVLTRDRLLGTYEVKPTLARLKTTLLGIGAVLFLSGSVLFGLIRSQADADGMYGGVPILLLRQERRKLRPGLKVLPAGREGSGHGAQESVK